MKSSPHTLLSRRSRLVDDGTDIGQDDFQKNDRDGLEVRQGSKLHAQMTLISRLNIQIGGQKVALT